MHHHDLQKRNVSDVVDAMQAYITIFLIPACMRAFVCACMHAFILSACVPPGPCLTMHLRVALWTQNKTASSLSYNYIRICIYIYIYIHIYVNCALHNVRISS